MSDQIQLLLIAQILKKKLSIFVLWILVISGPFDDALTGEIYQEPSDFSFLSLKSSSFSYPTTPKTWIFKKFTFSLHHLI